MPSSTQPAAPPGLVLQIRTGAGYFEDAFTVIPDFTLYSDGQVIRSGARTAVYPGPALPPLLTGRLPDTDVLRAAGAAKDAGLAGSPSLGEPSITDQPTTRFVLVEEGRTHRAFAYALDATDDYTQGKLSPEQRDGRRRLRELQRQMKELAAGAIEPYRAATVSVRVAPATAPDPDLRPGTAPGEADWPLGDLRTGGKEDLRGRCFGFDGPEAAQVLAAADDAKSDTLWRSGGSFWSLSFRLELPGEVPCQPAPIPR